MIWNVEQNNRGGAHPSSNPKATSHEAIYLILWHRLELIVAHPPGFGKTTPLWCFDKHQAVRSRSEDNPFCDVVKVFKWLLHILPEHYCIWTNRFFTLWVKDNLHNLRPMRMNTIDKVVTITGMPAVAGTKSPSVTGEAHSGAHHWLVYFSCGHRIVLFTTTVGRNFWSSGKNFLAPAAGSDLGLQKNCCHDNVFCCRAVF